MATSDNGSLLSKMVSFVSGPSVRRPSGEDSDQEGNERADKAAIQAMMDRKLQNDVVRRREFELLRQMRKREPMANRIDLNERTSLFPTSILSRPGGRAQTIKKIDEIEQQMSQQWWKGKQVKASSQASKHASLSPSLAVLTAPPASPVEPVKAQELPLTDTMQGRLEASLYDDAPVMGGSEFPATLVEQFSYDPAVEDAAILFANGDYDGAAKSLQDLIRDGTDQGNQEEIWLSLFDLYRSTGDRTRFDGAAVDFAARYGRSAPQWGNALEMHKTLIAPEMAVTQAGKGVEWVSPAKLDKDALIKLQSTIGAGAEPWTLNWQALGEIDAQALPALSNLFADWCNNKHQLRFVGANMLDAMLVAATPAGDGEVSRDWWMLRLNSLRLARKEDEFELVALDFCITYELSPPPWDPAKSDLLLGEAPRATGFADSSLEPLSMGEELLTTLAGSFPGAGPWKASSFNANDGVGEESGTQFGLIDFAGEVLGDASEALDKLARVRGDHKKLVVDCKNLVRVDFQAAGNLLNWATGCTADGCKLEFKNVNRLVATFFSVVGIDEFVRIIPPAH